jgi:hypothetical protein
MSTLTKKIVIDKIEVLEDCQLQVRQKTAIMEDNVELSSSYQRWVLTPGQEIFDQDPKVQAVANALWSDEVLNAWIASQQQ